MVNNVNEITVSKQFPGVYLNLNSGKIHFVSPTVQEQ